jgi:hypothetical protein
MQKENLVKSKQRTVDFGEVNTSKAIVERMLDLIQEECIKLDSRFLEPACGDGNFLCEILKRKLTVILQQYKQQKEFEKFSLLACTTLYGIDLLFDNIDIARDRLYKIFEDFYKNKFQNVDTAILKSFKKILSKNIIQGDALSFKCGKKLEQVIVLTEWSLIDNSFKRRDFKYSDFISYSPIEGPNLFSDLGDKAFIPRPVKEYPLIKYYEIYES